jgi:hypothetical protein
VAATWQHEEPAGLSGEEEEELAALAALGDSAGEGRVGGAPAAGAVSPPASEGEGEAEGQGAAAGSSEEELESGLEDELGALAELERELEGEGEGEVG